MLRAVNPDYQEFVDAVVAFAEASGLDVRHNYSGRGMYGKTCLGIVVEDLSVIDDLINSGPPCRQDSMGLDTIVYWPRCCVEMFYEPTLNPEE